MRKKNRLPARRSVRLRPFDYSWPGGYFLTVCAHGHRSIFGGVEGQEMRLSPLGRLAEDCWREIPRHFPSVQLGEFVVMPNHLHEVLFLRQRARRGVPLRGRSVQLEAFGRPTVESIPTIVRLFKQAVARRAAGELGADTPLWQRGYYEHVIRNETELNDISHYIRQNPQNWASDKENPRRDSL